MQLRSDVRFKVITSNLLCLIDKTYNINNNVASNLKIMIEVFKIINEHIVGLMNHYYNNKKNQRFALVIIAKCDKLYEKFNSMDKNSIDKNDMDELMELMVMVKKKIVSHLKKILKKKKTYLSPSNLEQIALLKL